MIWTILMVLLTVICIIAEVHVRDILDSDVANCVFITSVIFGIIAGVVAFVMILAVCFEHTGHDRHLAELQARRDALQYQIDEGIYFGDAVGEFNGTLVYQQHLRHDPWTSWFVGRYWDEVEPVELG